MPELPEVETMVRDLVPHLVGRTFTAIELPFAGCIAWPDPSSFIDRIVGQSVCGITRRGKYARIALGSGDEVIVHRGMTGSLLLRAVEAPMESHVRAVLRLDNGYELRFNDPRKFGRVSVMDAAGAERLPPWHAMGPEPLDDGFTVQVLQARLHGRTGVLKPLLLNQRVIAGLGNIYVDEALFRAGVHPRRTADTLTAIEIGRIHGAIRDVLFGAIRGRGTTFSSYTDIEGRDGTYQVSLAVFHREGEPCPRCGATIQKLVVGGRGTHVCPACQPEGGATSP
jgi:formamidopyrimidine-DNA glycosylase